MRRSILMAALLLGCGRPPSQGEIDEARSQVEAAIEAFDQLRGALELLGLLPTYECGEPRRTFAGKAAEGAQTQYACLTATAIPEGDAADRVRVAFGEGGCAWRGHTVSGFSDYRYAGGEARMDLEADLRETLLDGNPLQAKAGYGTCGDEKRVWAAASGALPRRPSLAYQVDGRVGLREGMPLIGSDELVLDGPGELTHPQGTDRLTFTGLEYQLGQYLPKGGELLVETSSGHRLRARFTSTLWRLGQAELTLDEYQKVTVPLVR